MMTKDQQEVVSQVYRRFYDADANDKNWTNIDEQMHMLDWLDDNQLIVEAAVLYQIQTAGEPRCNQKHPITECFIPLVIDAVTSILDLFAETGSLHEKNRFILQYYLAMSQVGFIVY